MKGKQKASKFEPQDFISNMPDNVVTNIMDGLPLQDAVRTGILSRNWMFKWNMLTQLVFDEKFFDYLSKKNCEDSYGRIISRLLLHLKGDITKFVLYMRYTEHVEDVSHWILFLSRKGIQDLTLEMGIGYPLKLPAHLFSCMELKHLKLHNCSLHPPPSFHGFPNLLSLELHHVKFESGIFGKFLTGCLVLEILNMDYLGRMLRMSFPKVKLAEIAKLANLKILSLFLCSLNNTSSGIFELSTNSIFELVGFLPKLQELDLNFTNCKFVEGVAEKRFPTTFPSVKILKLSTIDLRTAMNVSLAFEVIKGFPNLETLEITTSEQDGAPAPGMSSPEVDYNTKGLLKQLQSVVFTPFKASENEVCLIKYLLACSPFLKKIVIRPHRHLSSGEQLTFAKKLLKLQRAYPVVDIDY